MEHPHVLKALLSQGIQKKYIRLLANIYLNSYAKIKTDKEGPRFQLQRGVKQGDPLSPKLFTCLLEEVFRELNWQNQGININGKRLSNLRFADDIILFSYSAKELETMLQELQTLCQHVGLQINMSKTQVMTNKTKTLIEIGTETIKYVDEYIYLGQTISFHNSTHKEINRRVSQAWKAFWSLSFILMDKSQKIRTKSEILNSCILPVLTYGSQTWTLTQRQKTLLQVTQRKMERKILNISIKDRIRNAEIRQTTQIKDVISTAEALKWKWAGHTARLDQDRWAYVATTWDPRNGQRHPGRPRTRWTDDIVGKAGRLWTRVARDRRKWKNHKH